ncbi:glycosyltransferase family 4 protein [Microcoleus sp. N3A4]|uniref:glycosyltransferase family 4 protein n=1 Tax=Microcoleus sp. N3A4 TaxID=3055379 RepID=UPI002FD795AF
MSKIGGAQRLATEIMGLPGVEVDTATYPELESYTENIYDIVLLHVWRDHPNLPIMNWPGKIKIPCKRIIVFSHSWSSRLDFQADQYMVPSKFAYENSWADSLMHIIPLGIPTEQYSKFQLKVLNHSPVVGRLSTMLSSKISSDTIHFWREIPVQKFLIGGGGPQFQTLQIAFSDDPRFLFTGEIPPKQVPRFLRQIDIFLYDTVSHIESFCRVILEAMAAGCVVVAKDKGAIKELIEHEQTGFLYSSNKEALLICEHLLKNPNLRESISLSAQRVALLYSLDKFYTNILKVINLIN